jgi:hypothetical protein
MKNNLLLSDFPYVVKKSFDNRLESYREFNKIAGNLFNCQALMEHCHRSTKSDPLHEALGEAYEDFAELKDKIIEGIMGYMRFDYGDLKQNTIPEYDPEFVRFAAELTCNVAKQIEGFAKRNGISGVEGYAQELHGVGTKLMYKLTLNNPFEREICPGCNKEIDKKDWEEHKKICTDNPFEKAETREDALARAKKHGFPASNVVESTNKKGKHYISPHGVTSEKGKKTYAALRSEGKSKETAAKIAHSVEKSIVAGETTGQQTLNRTDLSAAPLKAKSKEKDVKNMTVPTLNDYPYNIRKSFK